MSEWGEKIQKVLNRTERLKGRKTIRTSVNGIPKVGEAESWKEFKR